MLRSEQDAVRRIVREEIHAALDTALEELALAADSLDLGPASDVPGAVVYRVVRQVQATHGWTQDKSDDSRNEETTDGT